MAITVSLTPYVGDTPQYGVQAQLEFVQRAEYSWTWLSSNVIDELTTFQEQANALEANVNAKEVSAQSAKTAAELAETNAETAMATAYATANFKGAWDSLTDFGNSSCEYLGLVYVSKINPNVNHLPSDTASWTPLTQALPIDETISHLSVTDSAYTDGNLTSMTYTGGYKTLYIYVSGNLSTVEYTDTDGTTVLLTETFTYTSGNLTSVTRT